MLANGRCLKALIKKKMIKIWEYFQKLKLYYWPVRYIMEKVNKNLNIILHPTHSRLRHCFYILIIFFSDQS